MNFQKFRKYEKYEIRDRLQKKTCRPLIRKAGRCDEKIGPVAAALDEARAGADQGNILHKGSPESKRNFRAGHFY
jgi:hypothetical protein